MAISRYIRTNNIPVVIFAESETGYFTHVIDSDNLKKCDCEDSPMRVAACGISPTTIAMSWSGLTNATATTNNFITCSGSYGSPMYPGSFPYTALYGSITIKNEHGSHYGTQSCTNEKCYYSSSNSGCVGVKHNESNAGWIFKGWEVSCASGSGFNIPSANYERVFSGGQYVWSISDPTEEDLGNALILYEIKTGSSITIEAVYEEMPKYSVSFDIDGGTGDAPTVEVYVGNEVTIPDYAPTKSGYIFLGWATTQGASVAEYEAGDSFVPSQDTILYAVWQEDEEPDEPDEPDEPGVGGGSTSTKGFMCKSSTSDFLIFSSATGNLVYN